MSQSSVKFGKKRVFLVGTINFMNNNFISRNVTEPWITKNSSNCTVAEASQAILLPSLQTVIKSIGTVLQLSLYERAVEGSLCINC